jgi:hypothetical protein
MVGRLLDSWPLGPALVGLDVGLRLLVLDGSKEQEMGTTKRRCSAVGRDLAQAKKLQMREDSYAALKDSVDTEAARTAQA